MGVGRPWQAQSSRDWEAAQFPPPGAQHCLPPPGLLHLQAPRLSQGLSYLDCYLVSQQVPLLPVLISSNLSSTMPPELHSRIQVCLNLISASTPSMTVQSSLENIQTPELDTQAFSCCPHLHPHHPLCPTCLLCSSLKNTTHFLKDLESFISVFLYLFLLSSYPLF